MHKSTIRDAPRGPREAVARSRRLSQEQAHGVARRPAPVMSDASGYRRTTPYGVLQELRHFMAARKDSFVDYFLQARGGASAREQPAVALRKSHVSHLVQRCLPGASKEDLRYVALLVEAALPQHAAVTLQDLAHAFRQGAKIERLVADGRLPGGVRALLGAASDSLGRGGGGVARQRADRAFADLDLGHTGRLSPSEQVSLLRALLPQMQRIEQLWLSAALFFHADSSSAVGLGPGGVSSLQGGGVSLDGLSRALASLLARQPHKASPSRRCSSYSAAEVPRSYSSSRSPSPPHAGSSSYGSPVSGAGHPDEYGYALSGGTDPRRAPYGYPGRAGLPPPYGSPPYGSLSYGSPRYSISPGRGARAPSPPPHGGAPGTDYYLSDGMSGGYGSGMGSIGGYGSGMGSMGGDGSGMGMGGGYGGGVGGGFGGGGGMYAGPPPFVGGTLRAPMGFSVTDTVMADQVARQEVLDPKEQEAGHAYYAWMHGQREKVLQQWFNQDHELKVKVHKEQIAKLDLQKTLKADAFMTQGEIRKIEMGMAKLAYQVESNCWEMTGFPPVSTLSMEKLTERVMKAMGEAVTITRTRELAASCLDTSGGEGGKGGGLLSADAGLSLDELLERLTSPDWLERSRLPRNAETLKIALATRLSLLELQRMQQQEAMGLEMEKRSAQMEMEEARHQMAVQQQVMQAQFAMQASELQRRLMWDAQAQSEATQRAIGVAHAAGQQHGAAQAAAQAQAAAAAQAQAQAQAAAVQAQAQAAVAAAHTTPPQQQRQRQQQQQQQQALAADHTPSPSPPAAASSIGGGAARHLTSAWDATSPGPAAAPAAVQPSPSLLHPGGYSTSASVHPGGGSYYPAAGGGGDAAAYVSAATSLGQLPGCPPMYFGNTSAGYGYGYGGTGPQYAFPQFGGASGFMGTPMAQGGMVSSPVCD
ncbi:hypothetical protein FOA52_015746 [Chlamydomonas sp. UWO 241]|nr:hypothetical protein FOA52_015746 [Chlamydomonas sp. UWO 241]